MADKHKKGASSAFLRGFAATVVSPRLPGYGELTVYVNGREVQVRMHLNTVPHAQDTHALIRDGEMVRRDFSAAVEKARLDPVERQVS